LNQSFVKGLPDKLEGLAKAIMSIVDNISKINLGVKHFLNSVLFSGRYFNRPGAFSGLLFT